VSSDVHTAAREPSATVTIARREPCNYAILTGDFDKLRRGEEVYYVEDVGDTRADGDQGLGERRLAF
jgi:hypothetical protein